MYLNIIPPAPPLKPGQKAAPVNPDALATLETALYTQAPTPAGMGSCCSSCAHGGPCTGHGMGIFDSGMDITQWGWMEWAIVGLSAWGLTSIATSTGRGVRKVRGGVRKYRRRSARRRRLREELAAA